VQNIFSGAVGFWSLLSLGLVPIDRPQFWIFVRLRNCTQLFSGSRSGSVWWWLFITGVDLVPWRCGAKNCRAQEFPLWDSPNLGQNFFELAAGRRCKSFFSIFPRDELRLMLIGLDDLRSLRVSRK